MTDVKLAHFDIAMQNENEDSGEEEYYKPEKKSNSQNSGSEENEMKYLDDECEIRVGGDEDENPEEADQ